MTAPSVVGWMVMDVGGGIERSPLRSPLSRSRSAAEAVRMMRAGRPTATTSLGRVIPAGTRVPSPRNTRSPMRAPDMRMEAFPISQRSPTVAPTTTQRCPNVVRRPTEVGTSAWPTTTEFSSTAELGADLDTGARGADHRALRYERTLAEVGGADDDRRRGDMH